jgi:hypothetical protein
VRAAASSTTAAALPCRARTILLQSGVSSYRRQVVSAKSESKSLPIPPMLTLMRAR